jgi:endonuclease I
MRKILLSLCLMPVLAFAQAVLPTVWNFSTPGIATPPTGWTTGLGTNGNLTYSGSANSVGGDNIACRLDATGEFLTIWFAEKPGPLSYWVKGTGISPNPAFTGVFSIQESSDGASWSNLRSFTTASPLTGTMTRYVDNPAQTTRYVRFFYSTKESGSNVSLDSVMIKSAPAATTASVVLKKGTSTILNNTTFVYGNSAVQTFTLTNIGTVQALSVDSILLSGDHASDFSVGTFNDSVAANGSDTFSILFSPTSSGSRFATMRIYTNDAEKNPYTVNLYGISGLYASEPTQIPNITVTNVRTQALRVNFGKANTEAYIVLRKTGNTITEVPVDGVTYKKGDYIGGAQVAYIGTDTATVRPLYILANTDYSFSAFSFNGPIGYENYNTTNAPTATATTLNGEPGAYYNSIDPANSNFITQLHNKVTVHDTVFYSNYIAAMVNNYLGRDTTGGRKVVNCVYTGASYVYDEPFTWWTGQSNNPGTLTREHTFAQSWMPTNTGGTWPNGANGREYQEFNDLHHLFPADQVTANGKRSNNPFGVVFTPTYTSPTGQGKLGADSLGKTVYEPRDEHKGDLARALFYMLISYNGVSNVQWRLPASQDVNVLLQWHQQDPPSALEIARHEHIFTYQKNRNPFIDHPEWVNRINFNNMTYISGPVDTISTLKITAPAAGSLLHSDSTYSITWTSSNVDSVALQYVYFDSTTSSNVVTPIGGVIKNNNSFAFTVPQLSKNNVVIYVREFNPNKLPNLRAFDSVTVNFKQYVGLTENTSINHLVSMYPVPSSEVVNVFVPTYLKVNVVEVYDITGRLVNETTQTQLRFAQKGMYIVRVITNGGVATKRVIIE